MINLSGERLERSHIDEFNDCINKLGARFSEYAFANLFLFRKQHDYRVLREKGHLFLQGITYDGSRYIMPFSPVREIPAELLNGFMKDGFSLFPIHENDLPYFTSRFGASFDHNSDDSDYIYTREKIEKLPGRYLHKKRNLIKQYRTLYSYEDIEYDCSLAPDALKALDRWFELSGLPLEDTDYAACSEAINDCAFLNLKGMAFYADSVPVGFLLGEPLNAETFVFHFAKGVTAFKGIYAHMYNSFALSLPKNYKFLNLEQDLGKENLRQAKSTYLQDDLLKKYRVKLN
ncbi:MAG: phosphatidylglycerol lysyltransferase domain-containing protein [Deferribacteraceae bacterium]|jgi:hypothetical protein|nr:phosphatidylglycerol lysyltransferase domain-containing protein [Deferribacteraceae bacterium]